jgi:hypothetical protein
MVMNVLKISIILFCFNSILCGHDAQIIVATAATNQYSTLTLLTSADAAIGAGVSTQALDYVITYRMKYYDTAEVSAAFATDQASIAAGSILNTSSAAAETDYLYHYIRSNTGSYTIGPDSNRAATHFTGKQYVQYFYPQYKQGLPSNPYIVYNISVAKSACANTTGKAPLLTFDAVFFCSDEEAIAAFSTYAANPTASVALIKMDGTCTPNTTVATLPIAAGAVGLAAVSTICELLQGNDTKVCK